MSKFKIFDGTDYHKPSHYKHYLPWSIKDSRDFSTVISSQHCLENLAHWITLARTFFYTKRSATIYTSKLNQLQIFPTSKLITRLWGSYFTKLQISSDYRHPLIAAPLISTPTSYEVESSSNVNVSFSSLTSYTIYFHGYRVLCFNYGIDILPCRL